MTLDADQRRALGGEAPPHRDHAAGAWFKLYMIADTSREVLAEP
jgi:hypothetical protein